ncbi:MAG: GAF domain-containing protein [Bacteroidetes bacterium]|nr:GAF domain-containing protein [Bacteroidota bacterium]
MNLNIKQKIQLYIILSTVLVFVFTLGYISINSRNRDIIEAKRIINLQAESTSNLLQDRINTDINVARNIRNSFLSWHKYPRGLRDSMYLEMQKDILIANPEYISIATSWEYFHVDTAWQKPFGRILWGWYRENGTIKELKVERHLEGDDVNSTYYRLKTGKFELFNNPEPYSYTGRKEDAILSTNISIPLLKDNQFIGLVGIDVDQSRFQNIILQISPFERSYAFVLSNNLIFVAHPNSSILGKFMGDEAAELLKIEGIEEKIKSGKAFSDIIFDNYTNAKSYISFSPIAMDGINTNWTVGISVPIEVISKEANNDLYVAIIIGFLGIVFISLITWFISKRITIPVKKITSILLDIAKGKINTNMHFDLKTGDEFELMGKALNTSIDGLSEKTEFSKNIGSGNLKTDLNLLSDEDILGKSLLDMRNNLLKAKEEEEIRKIEDSKRNWATEGYAKFGDILRLDNDNMDSLSFKVLQNLVEYVGANQGGLFVINEDDNGNTFLEMSACFAYDRQKFMEKRIEIGEGLIGSCHKEGKTIYLTEIPETYIKISSGLGNENPKSLLLVPLKVNDQIFGIIELASFNKFEKHKIEFVEKIGESIASTISNIKISIRTNELLKKSRQQAEEMKAQEEEMRQNMEELAATQEEMARKTSETEGIINALDTSSFILEYDLKGYVTNISDSYCRFLGISRNDAIGKHHAYRVEFTNEQKKEYTKFWDDLKNGKIRKEHTKLIVEGKVHHLMETYAPIFDTKGEVVKIFKIANDVTESKTAYETFSKENEELINTVIEYKKQIELLKKENQKLADNLKKNK